MQAFRLAGKGTNFDKDLQLCSEDSFPELVIVPYGGAGFYGGGKKNMAAAEHGSPKIFMGATSSSKHFSIRDSIEYIKEKVCS